MKREQFIRQLTNEARQSGKSFKIEMSRGKGGHCVAWFDGKFTTIKSGEITPLMEKIIRKQLGL